MLRFLFQVACRLWRWLRSIGSARPVILCRPVVCFLETVMARAKFKATVGEVTGIGILSYDLFIRKASNDEFVLSTAAPVGGGDVEFVVPLLTDGQYVAYTLARDSDGEAGESPRVLFSTPENSAPTIADGPTIEFVGFVADAAPDSE